MHAAALLAALWLSPSSAADSTPRWTSVSVGHDHGCALDAHGRAYCWGNNHSAQLGARTQIRCGIVSESGHRSCYPLSSDSAVAVEGGLRFASISAGRDRTCALDEEGRAFCWGSYVPGGTEKCLNERPCSFTPIPYEAPRRFRALSVGSRAMCGISTDGEALCTAIVGGHRWWEVGDLRPAAPGKTGARAVDVFADWPTEHLCVVDGAGAAWCRGSNRSGQLGGGTPPGRSPEPVDSLVRVAGGVAFRQLVSQGTWVCGLDAAGQAHCWGRRSSREYQTPEPAPGGCYQYACATSPVAVAGALRFRVIGAHYDRICGLTVTGEAYCWGPEGEATREVPEHRFVSLAGNVEFGSGSCGITTSDDLYCWGRVNRPAGLAPIHAAR